MTQKLKYKLMKKGGELNGETMETGEHNTDTLRNKELKGQVRKKLNRQKT